MKLRRSRGHKETGVGPATALVDRRTKDLAKRLEPGQIAVIRHSDIDRIAAESLVEKRPAAVVNAVKSVSGRYPNLGPGIIVDAGIPLIDDVGGEFFDSVAEGEVLEIRGGEISRDGVVLGSGTVETAESISADMAAAETEMNSVMTDFIDNTIEYIRKDSDLLSDDFVVPHVRTDFTHRQALIVVRGYHYKEDLAMLRAYIRENKPVLIGVDGGADAILEAGYAPAMIVGDMDSVSDKALTCGAELVVHAYRDGRAPGVERLEELGVDCVLFPASGTSEDIAMLLADDKGAELIVAVGTHDTIIEFLDKGRKGMASTFITRLRVGSKLIDAKGVSLLYHQKIPMWQLLVLAAAGLFAVFVALAATDGGQTFLALIGAQFDGLFQWIGGLFGAGGTDPSSLPTLNSMLAPIQGSTFP